MYAGPVYEFKNGSKSLILGLGLHFDGLGFASSYSGDGYLSYVLGIGAFMFDLIPINDYLFFSPSAHFGYDFIEIAHLPKDTSYSDFLGSISFSASIGFSFKFKKNK